MLNSKLFIIKYCLFEILVYLWVYKNNKTRIMEKIKTTPELAKELLDSGKRKITIGNGDRVSMINLNNQTCMAGKNNSECMFNNEDIEFFINVPANCKTVY